ncbi:MAG TPA: lipoprotein-releasing ABC transporter permease subunit [Gammaproteobacteria bacterium]|jgi:lipoprotein-releasing system permease protein|nr:lipoprotein-releasing ABC transporter permease subunit [Gammaproteobacteria bacterium]
MFRPFPLFVGLRYFRAKRRNQFISFISGMSLVSIAIGVMALITVLSVMNGFQDELRDRILSMTADATVSGFDNRLQDWPAVVRDVHDQHGVVAAAPYIEDQAMLANGANMSGTEIRGVIPDMEATVSEVGQRMVMGKMQDLTPGSYDIVLGKDLAYSLGAAPGDKVILMISQGNVTPAGLIPRFRRFTVSGIFDAGMYEYDRGLAFINIKDAQTLYGFADAVSGVRLKLQDKYQAPQVARTLTSRFQGAFYVTDWTQEHVNFFKAIAMEKTVMFIILSLIELVAAISIAITLVMAVTDKQADIAILRTLGASPRSIMGVFIVQGTIIGFLGTLIGLILGVVLATYLNDIMHFLQHVFHTEFLPSSVYYISDLPASIVTSDVLKITIASFVLSVISTLYPAWRAANTQPAEALRYE